MHRYEREAQEWLLSRIAESLEVDKRDIDPSMSFSSSGLDSLAGSCQQAPRLDDQGESPFQIHVPCQTSGNIFPHTVTETEFRLQSPRLPQAGQCILERKQTRLGEVRSSSARDRKPVAMVLATHVGGVAHIVHTLIAVLLAVREITLIQGAQRGSGRG